MKEETIQILKNYQQDHILAYEYLLNQQELNSLEKQILNIDFEQLKDLYGILQKKPKIQENKIEHISYTDKAKLSQDKKQQLEKIGEQIIKTGKYAVITMAGGQGTRLRT